MQYIGYTKPKLLIADEGKLLRDINDIYKPAQYDDKGVLIEEEHNPYYTSVIFLGDQINSLEECEKLYVEEEKE